MRAKVLQWLLIWRRAYGGIIMAVQGMQEMQGTCYHDYDCDCALIAAELSMQD